LIRGRPGTTPDNEQGIPTSLNLVQSNRFPQSSFHPISHSSITNALIHQKAEAAAV
jgi:hypothetical protein